jgi:hypothetical protein
MRVEPILDTDGEKYRGFLSRCETAMIYHSPVYLRTIEQITNAEPYHLGAINEEGEICGAILAYAMTVPDVGSVVNALPFYGGHGGVLCDSGPDRREINEKLLQRYFQRHLDEGHLSTTLISSPFDSGQCADLSADLSDVLERRTGQVTYFPAALRGLTGEPLDDALLSLCHSKTRNLVRKAMKLKLRVSDAADDAAWRFLIRTHTANMRTVGAVPKPESFFDAVRRNFAAGKDYRLYTVFHEGAPVGALLMFYFNGMAEYFVPAIDADARSMQPNNLAIFQAMRDCVEMGIDRWNWGGTPDALAGVYHFKKRWGAVDRPYHYYVRGQTERIFEYTPAFLASAFPYFFVYPFSAWTDR